MTSGLAGRRGRCPRSSASGSLPARPLPCAGPTREDARSPGPPLYQLGFDSQVLVQGWMDCVRMNGESPWEMVPRRKAPLLPGDTARSAAQREAPGSATAAAPPSRRSVPRRALGGPPRPRQRGARLAPRPAPRLEEQLAVAGQQLLCFPGSFILSFYPEDRGSNPTAAAGKPARAHRRLSLSLRGTPIKLITVYLPVV